MTDYRSSKAMQRLASAAKVEPFTFRTDGRKKQKRRVRTARWVADGSKV